MYRIFPLVSVVWAFYPVVGQRAHFFTFFYNYMKTVKVIATTSVCIERYIYIIIKNTSVSFVSHMCNINSISPLAWASYPPLPY